ncbi:MAG TPA: serine hydrolase domain-containing protein [Caulobacteraceae bacterium]|jgi:CubicO group peptidase (beta-lactamase class C family)|nr:serine hydrolase domain-containing protein [Caulobacteraceae bacterium]
MGQTTGYPALGAFLEGFVEARQLPGVCVAVRRRGEAPRFLSLGTLAFDSDRPMGPDSICRLASMTKPIVGIATMRLIEEGRIGLDQPLAEIMPAFASPRVLTADGTRPAARPILIRHLLSHSAGLSYFIHQDEVGALYRKHGLKLGGHNPVAGPGELAPPKTLAEFAERLAAEPLQYDPGTRWHYSTAPDLLGAIVEQLSGMRLADYFRAVIFDPLDMRDTDFTVPASKQDRLTTQYMRNADGLFAFDAGDTSEYLTPCGLPTGGSGLVTTARDYDRFAGMLLNEGSLDGQRVLQPETVRIARSNLLPGGVTYPARGADLRLDLPIGEPYPGDLKLGYGAQMQAPRFEGDTERGIQSANYGWGGSSGTNWWVDPVGGVSIVAMGQLRDAQNLKFWQDVDDAVYADIG